MKTFYPVSDEAQEMLDYLTDQAAAESFDEVDKLLDIKEPGLSQELKSSFRSCTWWDGDYYCQDEDGKWHLVDLGST